MDAAADAPAAPEGGADVAAPPPSEDAPAVRTFQYAPTTTNWADDDDDEPLTADRQQQYEQLLEKYRSRSERFGTEAKDPSKQVRFRLCKQGPATSSVDLSRPALV